MRSDLPTKNAPNILLLSEGVLLRNFVGAALNAVGYLVLRAANSDEALQLLTSHSEPVAVLLVCNPHPADLELIDRCTSAHPRMKAIILSAEMNSILAELAECHVCSPALAVPEVLLQTIERAISDGAFTHQIGSP